MGYVSSIPALPTPLPFSCISFAGQPQHSSDFSLYCTLVHFFSTPIYFPSHLFDASQIPTDLPAKLLIAKRTGLLRGTSSQVVQPQLPPPTKHGYPPPNRVLSPCCPGLPSPLSHRPRQLPSLVRSSSLVPPHLPYLTLPCLVLYSSLLLTSRAMLLVYIVHVVPLVESLLTPSSFLEFQYFISSIASHSLP